MQTMVPLYGSGGTGVTLNVTAPAGVPVTVSKDGKRKTKRADSSGAAVFKGLATGEWTLSIDNGEQTRTQSVLITADYAAVIAFFAATIHMIYPEGSTCTATEIQAAEDSAKICTPLPLPWTSCRTVSSKRC